MGLIVKRFYAEDECSIEAYNFDSKNIAIAIWEDDNNPLSRNTIVLDIKSIKKFKKELGQLIKEIDNQ